MSCGAAIYFVNMDDVDEQLEILEAVFLYPCPSLGSPVLSWTPDVGVCRHVVDMVDTT